VNTKPDIVSLKWVIGLIKSQADAAEASLVEFGKDPEQKQALLRCMWSVHQITSTFKALGMRKAEMLTLEMERSLNFLYKGRIPADRQNLTLGGLMQALKIIPAYLEHTENLRIDTGLGLELFVNDLRRWAGERPRPRAFFFYTEIPEGAGITEGASPASADEIRSRANVMLALYLEMAKQALRKVKVAESMKNVARIARKMQTLFAGTEQERFWFTMIGLCEGIAGGLIIPVPGIVLEAVSLDFRDTGEDAKLVRHRATGVPLPHVAVEVSHLPSDLARPLLRRALADKIDGAADGIATVQGTLWPAQHLDAFDIHEPGQIEDTVLGVIDAVPVDAYTRFRPHREVGATHTAYGHPERRDGQRGRSRLQVTAALDAEQGQRIGIKGANRGRCLHDGRFPLVRGDDDFLKSLGGLSLGQRRGHHSASKCHGAGIDVACFSHRTVPAFIFIKRNLSHFTGL
jgi:hypothetical protein